MLHRDNPALQLAFEADNVRIYTPMNIAEGYHTSRYVEALNQQIYSNAGATKETLRMVLEDMILRCNKQADTDTLKTDIAALANSVLYRLKYPVDQHCAIRMGAILSFMEYDIIENEQPKTISEDVDKCQIFWTQKKEQLAMNNPDAYAFFLDWGVSNTATYKEAFDSLNDSDYFLKREQEIASLMPQPKT